MTREKTRTKKGDRKKKKKGTVGVVGGDCDKDETEEAPERPWSSCSQATYTEECQQEVKNEKELDEPFLSPSDLPERPNVARTGEGLGQFLEENIQEGEEHLNSLENENAEESKKVKEAQATHGEPEKMSTEKPREVASEREKKVAEMQQVLDCKERQAEELRQSVQTMIEEKSKEMSALISSVEQIEDSQAFRKKRISKIDAAVKDLATEMERLNNEKRETVQECDAADENIKKIEKKKKKLENFLQSYSTEANTNIAKLQREIDSLQRLLNAPDNESEPVESEVMTKANPELLQFMERQIDAVEKELECPICLEIASQAPIFKCEEDHLICSKCRVKVRCCPQCREEYPEGPHKRYRGAERQAERLAGMYKERESLLHPR